MANTKLVFLSNDISYKSELQCYCDNDDNIFIRIDSDDSNYDFISLDKETAIKLVRTLKAEISKISDNG